MQGARSLWRRWAGTPAYATVTTRARRHFWFVRVSLRVRNSEQFSVFPRALYTRRIPRPNILDFVGLVCRSVLRTTATRRLSTCSARKINGGDSRTDRDIKGGVISVNWSPSSRTIRTKSVLTQLGQ